MPKNVVVSVEQWRQELAAMSAGLKEAQPAFRARASGHPFQYVQPNVSTRDGLSRTEYESYRPEEATGCDPGSIRLCLQAYYNVPVVHNVLNLMSDFCVQGIDVVHPNPEVEKFYKDWFRGANGPERSERITNMALKAGSAVVLREEESTRPKGEGVKPAGAAPRCPGGTRCSRPWPSSPWPPSWPPSSAGPTCSPSKSARNSPPPSRRSTSRPSSGSW
jgi:hypothetical protein